MTSTEIKLVNFISQFVHDPSTPIPADLLELVEQNKKDEAERQVMRAEMSKAVQQALESKKEEQAECSHRHRNGDPHFILISANQDHAAYILCQLCHFKVAPEPAPESPAFGMTYNTARFNSMYRDIVVLPWASDLSFERPGRWKRFYRRIVSRWSNYTTKLVATFKFTEEEVYAMPLAAMRTLNTHWRIVHWYQQRKNQ